MALAKEGKKSLAAAPVTMTGIGFHELLGCFQYLVVSRSCSSEGLDCIRQQLSDAATMASMRRRQARERLMVAVLSCSVPPNGTSPGSPATVHLFAREDGKLQSVPFIRLLKQPRPRRGFVTQKQFDELLAALPSHLRLLIQFLYW